MLNRYLITSQKFAGEVDTHYIDGVLQLINFENCKMSSSQIDGFKKVLPVVENELSAFSEKYFCNVVPKDYEVSFSDFWTGYNKKINKARCLPLWNKMSNTEQLQCVMRLKAYHNYRKRWNKYQYDPETYLRDKMWENDWQRINN